MEELDERRPYYGKETHGYCRRCTPPRRVFAGTAKPVVDSKGTRVVELECPLHGKFRVAEDSLDLLSGGGTR
jgi:hypothetical protein